MAADLDMYAMAVDAAARAEDEDGLSRYLSLAEGAAQRADHKLYIAVARRARGVAHRIAGEWDLAAGPLKAATDEFRALDTKWQIGRTLLELGEVERGRENSGVSMEHFAEALSAFETLGADPDAHLARAALESLS